MSLFIFILILVALIVAHEFGHFSVAKLFGIRVDEFGIGFPPRLFSVRWGETEYSLNLLFFGGFVRIFGEKESERGARSLTSKSRWTQVAVVLAGVFCNMLFAWLAFSAAYTVGLQTSVEHVGVGIVQNAKATIVSVIKNSPAQKAGALPEDVIISMQTGATAPTSAKDASAVREFIGAHQEESIVFTIERRLSSLGTNSGRQIVLLARPEAGLIAGKKALGIGLDDVGMLQLPPHLALLQGGLLSYQMTVATAHGIGSFLLSLARGNTEWSGLAGPIGIVGLGSAAVKNGFVATALLAGLISINLALINLIPIPGLDGGRLLFIAVEGVLRRPISPRLSLWLTIAGFSMLILLTLIVSYNDVVRLI